MPPADQQDIDARIQRYYGEVFDESSRLTTRSPQGPLEFRRTQEVIREHVQVGRVVDIGGGAGVHAAALQDSGYVVELVEPVQSHVDAALAAGVSAQLGDARSLPFEDRSFEAALMLGPLYHLASSDDRQTALKEAGRVVRPGGVVLAAGLSRYVAFGAASLGSRVPSPMPQGWAELIADGKPSGPMRFPAGHFHTSEELSDELEAAGLDVLEVVGVEGPAGLFLEVEKEIDSAVQDAAMILARAAAAVPGIRDQSAHLLGVARTKG